MRDAIEYLHYPLRWLEDLWLRITSNPVTVLYLLRGIRLLYRDWRRDREKVLDEGKRRDLVLDYSTGLLNYLLAYVVSDYVWTSQRFQWVNLFLSRQLKDWPIVQQILFQTQQHTPVFRYLADFLRLALFQLTVRTLQGGLISVALMTLVSVFTVSDNLIYHAYDLNSLMAEEIYSFTPRQNLKWYGFLIFSVLLLVGANGSDAGVLVSKSQTEWSSYLTSRLHYYDAETIYSSYEPKEETYRLNLNQLVNPETYDDNQNSYTQSMVNATIKGVLPALLQRIFPKTLLYEEFVTINYLEQNLTLGDTESHFQNVLKDDYDNAASDYLAGILSTIFPIQNLFNLVSKSDEEISWEELENRFGSISLSIMMTSVGWILYLINSWLFYCRYLNLNYRDKTERYKILEKVFGDVKENLLFLLQSLDFDRVSAEQIWESDWLSVVETVVGQNPVFLRANRHYESYLQSKSKPLFLMTRPRNGSVQHTHHFYNISQEMEEYSSNNLPVAKMFGVLTDYDIDVWSESELESPFVFERKKESVIDSLNEYRDSVPNLLLPERRFLLENDYENSTYRELYVRLVDLASGYVVSALSRYHFRTQEFINKRTLEFRESVFGRTEVRLRFQEPYQNFQPHLACKSEDMNLVLPNLNDAQYQHFERLIVLTLLQIREICPERYDDYRSILINYFRNVLRQSEHFIVGMSPKMSAKVWSVSLTTSSVDGLIDVLRELTTVKSEASPQDREKLWHVVCGNRADLPDRLILNDWVENGMEQNVLHNTHLVPKQWIGKAKWLHVLYERYYKYYKRYSQLDEVPNSRSQKILTLKSMEKEWLTRAQSEDYERRQQTFWKNKVPEQKKEDNSSEELERFFSTYVYDYYIDVTYRLFRDHYDTVENIWSQLQRIGLTYMLFHDHVLEQGKELDSSIPVSILPKWEESLQEVREKIKRKDMQPYQFEWHVLSKSGILFRPTRNENFNLNFGDKDLEALGGSRGNFLDTLKKYCARTKSRYSVTSKGIYSFNIVVDESDMDCLRILVCLSIMYVHKFIRDNKPSDQVIDYDFDDYKKLKNMSGIRKVSTGNGVILYSSNHWYDYQRLVRLVEIYRAEKRFPVDLGEKQITEEEDMPEYNIKKSFIYKVYPDEAIRSPKEVNAKRLAWMHRYGYDHLCELGDIRSFVQDQNYFMKKRFRFYLNDFAKDLITEYRQKVRWSSWGIKDMVQWWRSSVKRELDLVDVIDRKLLQFNASVSSGFVVNDHSDNWEAAYNTHRLRFYSEIRNHDFNVGHFLNVGIDTISWQSIYRFDTDLLIDKEAYSEVWSNTYSSMITRLALSNFVYSLVLNPLKKIRVWPENDTGGYFWPNVPKMIKYRLGSQSFWRHSGVNDIEEKYQPSWFNTAPVTIVRQFTNRTGLDYGRLASLVLEQSLFHLNSTRIRITYLTESDTLRVTKTERRIFYDESFFKSHLELYADRDRYKMVQVTPDRVGETLMVFNRDLFPFNMKSTWWNQDKQESYDNIDELVGFPALVRPDWYRFSDNLDKAREELEDRLSQSLTPGNTLVLDVENGSLTDVDGDVKLETNLNINDLRNEFVRYYRDKMGSDFTVRRVLSHDVKLLEEGAVGEFDFTSTYLVSGDSDDLELERIKQLDATDKRIVPCVYMNDHEMKPWLEERDEEKKE